MRHKGGVGVVTLAGALAAGTAHAQAIPAADVKIQSIQERHHPHHGAAAEPDVLRLRLEQRPGSQPRNNFGQSTAP